MTYRKKLIEVALPLEAINVASAREKSIRHGHPSTLHLWWARRPLAACRAVLFSSLVDDPGEYIADEKAAHAERERLFRLIEKMVLWENVNNEEVLDQARLEIARSVARNLGVDAPIGREAVRQFLAEKAPPVLDPFAGGGSIPLEAQRLGLRVYASDLNPVAVLINKALIEIPPRFADCPPVHPADPSEVLTLTKREWRGAQGLAEDVRYYGKWMRDEAEERIGHLYPKVILPKEYGGGEATVIAWLWARTVKCPNPACGAQMPLVRSFELSKKKGKQAWVDPVVNKTNKTVKFLVKTGSGKVTAGTVNRRGARCIVCESSVPFEHIRVEGKAGRMSAQLMAIVAEGENGRVYVSPSDTHARVAASAKPAWSPDTELPEQALGFRVQLYGMTKHRDLFTLRQLVALTMFSDLVSEARQRIYRDALVAGLKDDDGALESSGSGARAYGDAVAIYLAFVIDRLTDYWSCLNSWQAANQQLSHTFARQALPMVWDYAEGNPFSGKGGSFDNLFEWTTQSIRSLSVQPQGFSDQRDAMNHFDWTDQTMIATDPPYYDNVPYADLSDFFYIWMRRSLSKIYPNLFNTVLTPKTQELIAEPYRQGGNEAAQRFFEKGLRNVFLQMRSIHQADYPMTLFYAFKQSESDDAGDSIDDSPSSFLSTGWETMLEGLINARYAIVGTWPISTEMEHRMRGIGSNALASSIVLVCRPLPDEAPRTTRREFFSALKRELPIALHEFQQGYIAPVDLAQAAIGPGMAVFSRYREVLEPDGTPMRVRTALALINQVMDEYLTEQEGEYDADTRWALAWFEQYGHEAGPVWRRGNSQQSQEHWH